MIFSFQGEIKSCNNHDDGRAGPAACIQWCMATCFCLVQHPLGGSSCRKSPDSSNLLYSSVKLYQTFGAPGRTGHFGEKQMVDFIQTQSSKPSIAGLCIGPGESRRGRYDPKTSRSLLATSFIAHRSYQVCSVLHSGELTCSRLSCIHITEC